MTDNKDIQASSTEIKATSTELENSDSSSNKIPKKKGWLRIPGVIAFASVVGIVGAGAYFFAEPLLETAIETAGTQANGAKVELDSVDLELFPAKLILHGMTAADAEQPMQNLFEFSRAESSIDLLKLAMGQVIIPELALQGLQFGTERQSSGHISAGDGGSTSKNNGSSKSESSKDPSSTDSKVKEFTDGLSEELPSVDDILAREPLLIDQRKKEWDAAYAEQKEIWKDLESKLPDSEKLKDYEKRVKAITKTKIKSLQDFEKQRKALEKLKADIKADKKVVKQAASQFKESKQILETHLKTIKEAPQQDWDRLVNKYSFDQGGLTNLAGLLFGPQMREYTDKALYWYNKIKPHLSSGEKDSLSEEDAAALAERHATEGRFVRFAEDKPIPDFLIEKALVSAIVPRGEIDIEAKNITHQQSITGLPTTIHAFSSALKDIEKLELNAVIDQRAPERQNKIDLQIDKLLVDQVKLGSVDGVELELSSAKSDIKGNLLLANDATLKGDVISIFNETKFDGEAPNRFSKELLATLQTVPKFELKGDIGGTIESPDISVSSDLDKRLKQAFSARFEEKKAEFIAEINVKLQEKLTGYLDSSQVDLPVDADELDLQSNQLDNLLKTKLDDFKDQQKDKLKNKAKDKLKDKFGDKFKGLF